MSKIKIIPTGGTEKDVIEVFSVDAKEAVESGAAYFYYVGDQIVGDFPKESKEMSLEEKSYKVNSMNTKELIDYVKTQSITIEDFENLNLKSKREAVVSYLNKTIDEDLEDL